MKQIQFNALIEEAKVLIGEGENIEYTRGICELLASVNGEEDVDTGTRALAIAEMIGVKKEYSDKFYSSPSIN